MKKILTSEDFLRLWSQIIFNNDFKYVWPQSKILSALRLRRVLRFVREDLFEPSISDITAKVLLGCLVSQYGLLVKTSSVHVVNYIREIKKLRHCIIFSVTDLLSDYQEKVKAINHLCREGLNVTLSLTPIFEFNDKTKYILSSITDKILGVEVGWLHSVSSYIPAEYLCRDDYKYVRFERQYKRTHLREVVRDICSVLKKRSIKLNLYFSSEFYSGGACCFADRSQTRLYKAVNA